MIRVICALLALTFSIEAAEGVENREQLAVWKFESQLGMHKDDRSIPLIREFFAGLNSSKMKIEAIGMMDSRYVYSIPDSLVPELLGALIKDPDVKVRARAAKAIGYNGVAAKFRPELTELLKEQDIEIKAEVVYAMSRDIAYFAPQVIELLKHENAKVRNSACSALFAGGARYKNEIAGMLKDPEVAGCAIQALSSLQAAEFLPEILPFLENENPRLRDFAIEAVALLGKEKLADKIAARLKDSDDWVRAVAARQLGKLKATQYLNEVAVLLKDDVRPRRLAIEAIGEMGDPSHAAFIEPFLKDEDSQCRELAEKALGKLRKIGRQ